MIATPVRFFLGNGAPDLFTLRLPSLNDDALCDCFAADCSPHRSRQAERYRRQEDRLRCLAAGWLLDHAVRLVTGTGAVEEKDAQGKSVLSNLPHLGVSLSHAGAWVVCALHGAAVGIDVEIEAPPEEGMAKLFMSKRELSHYLELPDIEEQIRFFFAVWTMKEAYLKALGTGFSRSPRQVSLDIGEDTVVVEDAPERGCASTRLWRCHTARLPGEAARLSLCWLHRIETS